MPTVVVVAAVRGAPRGDFNAALLATFSAGRLSQRLLPAPLAPLRFRRSPQPHFTARCPLNVARTLLFEARCPVASPGGPTAGRCGAAPSQVSTDRAKWLRSPPSACWANHHPFLLWFSLTASLKIPPSERTLPQVLHANGVPMTIGLLGAAFGQVQLSTHVVYHTLRESTEAVKSCSKFQQECLAYRVHSRLALLYTYQCQAHGTDDR